jgi:hypothetical protein
MLHLEELFKLSLLSVSACQLIVLGRQRNLGGCQLLFFRRFLFLGPGRRQAVLGRLLAQVVL